MNKEAIRIYLAILSVFFLSNSFAQQGKNEQILSIIPDSCEFMTLYNAKDLDLQGWELFLNWKKYPYIIKGGTIVGLFPDSAFTTFKLPNKSSPSQILCAENGVTYLKSNNLIQIMEDDVIRTLFSLKNNNFQINLASANLLYITTFDKDSSTVFLFDTELSLIIKLVVVEGKINDVAGNGLSTYIAKGNEIFLLSN